MYDLTGTTETFVHRARDLENDGACISNRQLDRSWKFQTE